MSNKFCGGNSTKLISVKSRFLSWSQVSQNLDEYKKDGIDTHYLSRELIPVYAVAITEENYFEDDRAIHNFSLRDSETKEELKVRVKGIEEKRNLLQIAFFRIEKNTNQRWKQVIIKYVGWNYLGINHLHTNQGT